MTRFKVTWRYRYEKTSHLTLLHITAPRRSRGRPRKVIQKRTKDDGENKPKVLRSGRKVDAKVQGGLQAHRSHVSMANKDRGHRTKVTPKGVSQGTDGTPDRIPARQISYPIAETAVHDVSPTEDPVTEDTGTVSLIGPAPRTTTEDLQHARLIFDIF